APAVRRAELELRMTIERAAEDQMRQRERRLDRLADDVRQIVGLHTLTERAAERVHEHDRTERLGALPEAIMAAGGPLLAAERRRDLATAKPQTSHGVGELLGR